MKASVAKFNAEELITKRETAKGVIANAIRNTLSHRDIIVETVFITDFKFSQAFADQIESKVVAFQKYLTEQNNLRAIQVIANQTVVQAEAQAKANVAKANGESQAIKVINQQTPSESSISTMAINQQMEWPDAIFPRERRGPSFLPVTWTNTSGTTDGAATTKSNHEVIPNKTRTYIFSLISYQHSYLKLFPVIIYFPKTCPQ